MDRAHTRGNPAKNDGQETGIMGGLRPRDERGKPERGVHTWLDPSEARAAVVPLVVAVGVVDDVPVRALVHPHEGI